MRSPSVSPVSGFQRLLLLAPLIVLLAWASDREAAAQPGETDDVTLQVSLYSGRPDPVLPLDPEAEGEALSEIARLVAAAPPAEGFEGPGVIPSILGYRGVLVHDPASRTGLPARVAVYDGFVETYDGESVSFFLDENRRLEFYLLELAVERGVVDAELLSTVRGDIGGSSGPDDEGDGEDDGRDGSAGAPS